MQTRGRYRSRRSGLANQDAKSFQFEKGAAYDREPESS